MATDSISVIVPAHNNAAVITRALQSIDDAVRCFRECGPQWEGVPVEVVVVDDCSTDGTGDVVRRLAADREHCRLVAGTGRSAASACAGSA